MEEKFEQVAPMKSISTTTGTSLWGAYHKKKDPKEEKIVKKMREKIRAKNIDRTKEVELIKAAIRSKDKWKEKMKNEEIQYKYRAELSSQGASKESIDEAFADLLDYEIIPQVFDLNVALDNAILMRDNLIPKELKDSIACELDKIANSNVKDIHPGSDGLVQDLIHPSLYPYIPGLSYVKNGNEKKEWDFFREPTRNANVNYNFESEDPWNSAGLQAMADKDHQWIPAEFDISKDGKAKIVSYINNLPRDKHPDLYSHLERAFEHVLPLFKEALQHVSLIHDSNGEPTDQNYWGDPQAASDSFNPLFKATKKWNPTRLQVIVKAANYILEPGQVYEGNWHVEGTPKEKIVASAIYYYENSTNLDDAGLAFRNLTGNGEGWGNTKQSYGGVNLGAFRTVEDRVIVFANNIQHRVTRIENPSKQTGTRKILCFFLVHPEQRILSSDDIPAQQWDEIKPRLALTILMIGKRLGVEKIPKDVVLLILRLAKWGFTEEEAKLERLHLMFQRKFFKNLQSQYVEREWSLCEH
eukprot:TRINITY_DN5091_c0_g3_i1.p1 TRINITY_DN5091_c0_g3~~TRINITY_DN5091_c0_g3_i1.p1  ORF type:complete len:578 (+),score=165.24 TRINITY_DN5091_c0_g3_i1:156-1736(+)